MQIRRLFTAHHVDTEKWYCQKHFDAQIDVKRDWFSVKYTGKSRRDSSHVKRRFGQGSR